LLKASEKGSAQWLKANIERENLECC
jgi:hypothetical protein